jgi:ATP adenylyltransferase/5',5'''-P-1,P-4-tetraphosphate phosphorylase II
MRENLLLSDSELFGFGASSDWSDKAFTLLQQQMKSWETLRSGYDSLSSVETKAFEIEGLTYRVEFNPGRITSSSAKVDEKSIKERTCFLCSDNLPEEQRAILYKDEYLILCNPFPIFPEHFTIAYIRHIPQEIRSSFQALLQLSKDLADRYTLFYNGPRCGASAPDHLHFQAGNKGFMPIDEEYEGVITSVGEKVADVDGLLVFAAEETLRRFISFESDDEFLLQEAFDAFYAIAQQLWSGNEEPMMNILASYQEGEWRVIIFPRAKHRPSFFFEEGEKKMVLSPAAVDFGGTVITPVAKDFRRMTEEILIQTFEEVSLPSDQFSKLRILLGKQVSSLRPL